MSRGCRSHLVFSGIIVWSMAIFRVSDGGSITWFDPPPFETVTDSAIISAVNKTLIKGFSDEELSCNFSLTADLSLITVSMKYGVTTIATYLQSQQALSVEPTFVSRLNATWVPNKLTLILFSVTDADKREYRCEVVTFGGSVQTWVRKIQVSLLVPSIITNITGKTEKERGNVTLKCLADGTLPIRITWTRLSDNTTVIMPLINISRHDVRDYRCTADNGVGNPATRDVSIDVQYPPEVNGRGQNATVATDVEHTFSCPVDGNPTPIITWYSETGAHSGKQFKTGRKGCYICVGRNTLGISDNITQCLIINSSLPTVPPTTERSQTMVSSITPSQRQEIRAILTIVTNYEQAFKDLNSTSSKEFVAKFVQEMDKVYMDMPQYIGTKVTQLRPGNVIVYFILYFKTPVTAKKGLENLRVAISSNGTFGDFQAKDLVLFSEKSAESTKTTGPSSSSTAGTKAGPPWIIIIAVAGGVVLLAILVGVLTWWVHKQRKCRKATKIHDSDLGRHDSEGGYSQVQGAYAHSGPPAANGADGADEQEIEVTGAIPTYAVVDKSKRSKKQTNEKPPEYAVVDKSKKKEKQDATAIPTYAAVDKSKRRKKSCEEVPPPVYAEVDKSKKKKKNIDGKNLKETLDEPKKEKKPGELLYADLGDFQNPGMPTVPISSQPLPAIKKVDPYERTDYADITQFLKGNATLAPNDGNGDTEMKPKRPSKKKIQGNDKETPI